MQKAHDDKDNSPISPYDEYTDAEELSASPEDAPDQDIPCLEQIAGDTVNPNLPVMVLDPDLMIISVTESVARLFRNHHDDLKKPFFNVFGKSLDQELLQNLLTSIRSHTTGFSWSGTLSHKTPSTTTLHTNTTFIPLIRDRYRVSGYVVHFSDITNEYNKRLRDTFQGIMEAAKLKDNDTGLHNERVGYYSKKMCEYLYEHKLYSQLNPDFIENIVFLAALHDVGKIGTPDYILQKPGKLTDLEWDIMREHTINGTFILASHPDPMAKEIALSHHEWWNGSGYPFKLEGDMIPLSARIVTISDVYDALRMKRTYKNEFTHEQTMAKINEGAGTQFDPALIEVFNKIHTDFNSIWELMRDPEEPASNTRDRDQEFSGTTDSSL